LLTVHSSAGRAGWSQFEDGSIEIGYAIKPEFWGHGYAGEAATALMQWAKSNRPENRLVGFALPSNKASLRILERIGMEILENRKIAGAEVAFYERQP
jgi:RimJ/RimL family protein N-acetyltransferase